MAVFGMPGGVELWIICFGGLFLLIPVGIVALIVVLVRKNSAPSVPVTPARWATDPSGRHELRYWDGVSWTTHVSDAGVQAEDSL